MANNNKGNCKKYYDDTGIVYRIGNQLTSNCQYTLNGYRYKTDNLGRITYVEGELHLKNRKKRLHIRDKIADIGKGYEHKGDDRGHLIADWFEGVNGLENMIAQNAHINRAKYKKLENFWAIMIKQGAKVDVKIEPLYAGKSYRPSAVVATYTVNGVYDVRLFYN